MQIQGYEVIKHIKTPEKYLTEYYKLHWSVAYEYAIVRAPEIEIKGGCIVFCKIKKDREWTMNPDNMRFVVLLLLLEKAELKKSENDYHDVEKYYKEDNAQEETK